MQDGFFVRPFGFSGDNPDNIDDGGYLGQLIVVNGDGPLGLGATLGLADGVPNAGFVPINVGEWFVLEHVLNLDTQTQEAYVDGQFIASAPFVNPANELSGVEFVVLNTPDHVIYFDDMNITAIPEPGSVALLSLGGLIMFGVRSRRR
ncbi:MAG: PEP-CTERM sorting domain-containing protein [Planctomycetota bacterium]